MKYSCIVPITYVLMAVAEMLPAAVMSGLIFSSDGQEIEENLIVSRRKSADHHDHRTDSAYAGILGDEDEVEKLKHMSPSETKAHMKPILEKMDRNKDGFIDKQELSNKLLESYRKLSAEESDSEFESSDFNDDGFVLWKEYFGEMYGSSENHDIDIVEEEKELFTAADTNNDGQLDRVEFRFFYSPEDYPHMKPTVTRHVLYQFDHDKDGKITPDEFIIDKQLGLSEEFIREEKVKFQGLDINNDGVLEKTEIYNWPTPDNNMVAESEADNLILKSDQNKDGVLSFDEILENYSAFISSENDFFYIFKDEL